MLPLFRHRIVLEEVDGDPVIPDVDESLRTVSAEGGHPGIESYRDVDLSAGDGLSRGLILPHEQAGEVTLDDRP